jgi:hypothetical protein
MPHRQSLFRTTPSTLGSGRNAALLMAAGWLLTKAWQSVSRARQLKASARSARLPEKLQTWEGEGGRPVPEDDQPEARDAGPMRAGH